MENACRTWVGSSASAVNVRLDGWELDFKLNAAADLSYW
jgi:hypothetical protein